jgi:4-aminobutyrate aminotransferase
VCLAAALETVRLLEESLIANAAKVGDYLRRRFEQLKPRHNVITEVRGRGLMIGVQLTTGELRDRIIDECFRRGLLLLGAGVSTVRVSPPLIVDEEQADCAIEIFDQALSSATV